MQTKLGFTKMSVAEFEHWIQNLRVARTILRIQQHHAYVPSYAHFSGSNHFERQDAMKKHHVVHNGWADIGQHFTIFPDGSILTGRNIENSPACITGQNANCICIENLGNFDIGQDIMTQQQTDAIIAVTAALCKRFNIAINSNSIVYHHWFDLNSGARNNGTKNNKSCPGTNFFGGNKVTDCEANFLPLIRAKLPNNSIKTDVSAVLKYVCVKSATLNVRSKSNVASPIVKDRKPATLGAVLRVYKSENGWLKISNSLEHWINEKFVFDVKRAVVNTDTLNVRSGPGTNFQKIGSLLKEEELFIVEENKNWCKINMEEKWVNKSFLKF